MKAAANVFEAAFAKAVTSSPESAFAEAVKKQSGKDPFHKELEKQPWRQPYHTPRHALNEYHRISAMMPKDPHHLYKGSSKCGKRQYHPHHAEAGIAQFLNWGRGLKEQVLGHSYDKKEESHYYCKKCSKGAKKLIAHATHYKVHPDEIAKGKQEAQKAINRQKRGSVLDWMILGSQQRLCFS
jgi:hypothetical protein